MVITNTIQLSTTANGQIIDITTPIAQCVAESSLENGVATIFTPSSTSAITTIEFESGCVRDLQSLLDDLIPQDKNYYHNSRWGDGNGHSHLRAALLGPSFSIPFVNHKLTLGVWQQVIFIDFDNKPRHRNLIVQIIGE